MRLPGCKVCSLGPTSKDRLILTSKGVLRYLKFEDKISPLK